MTIDRSPAKWQNHWASIPNSVRGLYSTFQVGPFPFIKKELRMEGWGQLCFDDAACRITAYHMWNHGMRHGFKFLSWRCEMDGEPTGGGKLFGLPPADFSFAKYGLGNKAEGKP